MKISIERYYSACRRHRCHSPSCPQLPCYMTTTRGAPTTTILTTTGREVLKEIVTEEPAYIPPGCPLGFRDLNPKGRDSAHGNCVAIFQPMTFWEAKEKCYAMGGHLPRIDSKVFFYNSFRSKFKVLFQRRRMRELATWLTRWTPTITYANCSGWTTPITWKKVFGETIRTTPLDIVDSTRT